MTPEFPPSRPKAGVNLRLFVASANDQSAEAQRAQQECIIHLDETEGVRPANAEGLLWGGVPVSLGGDQTAAAAEEQALLAPPDLRQ
ncbi:hypothetical protein V6Z92_001210 [Aspergillus fumigatus]